MGTPITYGLRSALIAFALMLTLSPAYAQMEHHHSEHAESQAAQHQHDMPGDAETGMARCAFDGMLMKSSAMVEREIDGMPVYFCNEDQAKAFAENAKRYRSEIKVGHLRVDVNLLTADEYMGILKAMGMAGMMGTPPLEGKSHHVAVYFTQHGQDIHLDNVDLTLRILVPDAEPIVVPLKYNQMAKYFEAPVDLQSDREYAVGVVITTPTVLVSY